MINVRRHARRVGAVLMTAALCFATVALADNQLETIVVKAGVMVKTVVDQTTIGAPVEEVTLTHRVSYADLDLTKHSDAMELKRRVSETARLACEQLDKLYPFDEKEAPECTSEATANAESQVDEAISAAEQKAKDE